MKLWFQDGDWEKERYRYAAEQMMAVLFPGEKPEYPDDPPPKGLKGEKSAVQFTLRREEQTARVAALVRWENGVGEGAVSFSAQTLDAGREQVYHVVARAVKQSFYEAGTTLLDREPPWGSLTGVRPTKIPTRALWNGASPAQADQELKEVYHVSPLRREMAMACAQESVKVKRTLMSDEISLYVGIPFCPSRCVYCSFISAAVDKCLPLVAPFTEGLKREISAAGAALREAGIALRSVYMGGGTPTTLSAEHLKKLLHAMKEVLPFSEGTEFTVEAGRPDTITPEKLQVLAEEGVQRISVNPQSMNDGILRNMGRPHTAEDIRRAFCQARAAGAFSINMDLIAGLPGDDPAGFLRSLEEVLALEPENVTVHTLALKKGAKLREVLLPLPSGDQVEAMLNAAWTVLRKSGYSPYYLYRQKYMSGSFENVGWTKPGLESIYNIIMMEELHTVLALGGGGVSKLVDWEAGKVRRLANPKYPQEYLRDIDKICAEKAELAGFLREMKGV